MKILINKLTSKEILTLLKDMSPQFMPPLSDTLNLETYAEKLEKNATFLTCNINGHIVGTIVFYLNYITSILYIPLVWVEKYYRGCGLAKVMFTNLIKYREIENLSYVDLEVLKTNKIAFELYNSLDFHILEDRGLKYLMRKYLKK